MSGFWLRHLPRGVLEIRAATTSNWRLAQQLLAEVERRSRKKRKWED